MPSAYFTVQRVHFEFRTSEGPDKNLGIINAIIHVEGQPASGAISTTIRCERKDWDTRKRTKPSESIKRLNRSLVLWEEAIFAAGRSLLMDGKPLTPQTLLDEKNHSHQPLITAQQAFEKYLDFKRDRIGSQQVEKRLLGQICKTTFNTYQQRWNSFLLFLQAKHKEKMLLLSIDAPFVQQYYQYLLAQPVAYATATKRVKLVTELCQWAYQEGLIRQYKTGGFRGCSQPETIPYNMTDEEVASLEAMDLSAPLARVRDGWLLARELCLHHGDYLDLKARHFSVDKQGRTLFDKPRRKQEAGRNIRQVIIASPRALSIWHRYKQQLPCALNGKDFANALKGIGQQAQLSQPLTFSHARDSGIFQLVVSGYPDFIIKLAAGWTTTRQLRRYVNHDRRLLEEYRMDYRQEEFAPSIASFESEIQTQLAPGLLNRNPYDCQDMDELREWVVVLRDALISQQPTHQSASNPDGA